MPPSCLCPLTRKVKKEVDAQPLFLNTHSGKGARERERQAKDNGSGGSRVDSQAAFNFGLMHSYICTYDVKGPADNVAALYCDVDDASCPQGRLNANEVDKMLI